MKECGEVFVNIIGEIPKSVLKIPIQEKLKIWGQTSGGNCDILIQAITFYEFKEAFSFEILDRISDCGDSWRLQLGAAAVR